MVAVKVLDHKSRGPRASGHKFLIGRRGSAERREPARCQVEFQPVVPVFEQRRTSGATTHCGAIGPCSRAPPCRPEKILARHLVERILSEGHSLGIRPLIACLLFLSGRKIMETANE